MTPTTNTVTETETEQAEQVETEARRCPTCNEVHVDLEEPCPGCGSRPLETE